LRPMNRREVIAGRPTNEFAFAEEQRELRVWFSDDAVCVVTRMQRIISGVPVDTTEMEYDLTTGFPRSWTTTRNRVDGTQRDRTVATIQEIDVTSRIPESL